MTASRSTRWRPRRAPWGTSSCARWPRACRWSMPEREDDDWRLEVFRARLRHSLPARFFLRFHVSLIVLATLLSGWLADVVMLRAGLRSMLLRYPLVIAASYGALLAGVGAWLRYSGIAEYVSRRKAQDLVGDGVPGAPAPPGVGWLDPSGYFNLTGDVEGCLLGTLAIVAIVAFGG